MCLLFAEHSLICKRRHLRCDEASPECGNCVKSKHSCLYAAPGPPFRLVQDSSHDDDETTHLAPQSPQASTIDEAVQPYQLNPNNGHDNNDNDGNDNTCTHPDPHYPRGPISDVALQPYPAAELISPSPSAATHHSFLQENENISFHPAPTPPDAAFYRWFGLLADDAADAADAADDGVTAVLRSQALIKGLSLETFRERYAIPSVIAPCLSEPPPAEAVSRVSWHGSRPAELSDNEVALLDNFVKRVSLWIDLYDPNRYFSVFVPHLAMRDAGLMTAILALSSRQLSISPNASESERDRRIGLQYYYDTLCYLQQAMSIDAYTTSLELLATALIVSMYEMLDDSGNGWERHLKGVFWIQRSQLIHGETGSLRSAVWWAWLRQDVWAAFRERRKTLSFWKPTKAYAAMDVYEIAARIVWIFAKAVDYCSDEEVAAGEDKVRMRIERADVLLAMLDEWKENLPVEFTPMPGITKATTSDSFQPLWIHPPAFGMFVRTRENKV